MGGGLVESALCAGVDGDVTLIETLRYVPGRGCPRAGAHLARLSRSAALLGWDAPDGTAATALAGLEFPDEMRVRLTLDRAGRVTVTVTAPPADIALWRLGPSPVRLRSDDPWLRMKSNRRADYDAARAGLGPGLHEAILFNERDEVCDGTITTLFFDLGEGLCTPPLRCGLLPGVLRAEMLDRGACREAVLRGDQIGHVRLWVGNSLRGLWPAVWAGEAP